MTVPDFDDRPPLEDAVTDYDQRHLVTYLRLLAAAKEQADWQEAARVLFGIDAAVEPQRARGVYESHLQRAEWMTRRGYLHLRQSD